MSYTALPARPFGVSMPASPVAEFIRVLRRQAWIASLTGLLVLGLVVATSIALPRRYAADASVYVLPDLPDPLAQDAAQHGVADDMVATVADLLRSRDLAARVVEAGHLGETLDAPSLAHKALCAALPFLGRCGPVAPPTEQARIDRFLAQLTVSTEERSRVITLHYASRNPAEVAPALNGLVAAYQELQIAARTADLQRTEQWIAHRADSLRERWLAAQAKLGAYRAEHGLGEAGSTAPTLIDQQIAHAAQELSLAQSALATAQARAGSLRSGGAQAALAEQPGVQAAAARVEEAQAALDSLRAQFGPRHPRVLAAMSALAAARTGLAAQSGQLSQGVQADVAAKQAAVASLTANLDRLRAQASQLSGAEVDLQTLNNEAQEARSAYDLFQSRAKQMADRTELLQPDIRFASHAVIPSAPSFPNVPKFIAGGVVLGLLAAVGAALAREHFRRGFANVSRIGEELSLSLLSIVPRVPSMPGGIGRYIEQFPFSDAAESMRALAARLQTSAGDAPRSLVIASATAGEGKTTVALWLAYAMAAAGQRILLVDGDHRRGTIASHLGGDPRAPGFADLLGGTADASAVVHRDRADRFDYVGAGSPTARVFGGPELRRLGETLRHFRERYDLVLIDTPPLLAMTEALLCAHAADRTVVIARWNATPREAVLRSLAQLNEAGASIAGVVLSMVERKRLALFSDEHRAADLKLIEGYYRAA